MVLTVYFALSLVIGLFVTIIGKKIRQFNASVEASGPHDFAVRLRRPRQKRHPRPSHPASRP
jgi:hypothetical protein